MRKNFLSKAIGCVVALAVVVPVISLSAAASCPITGLLQGFLGNNGNGSNPFANPFTSINNGGAGSCGGNNSQCAGNSCSGNNSCAGNNNSCAANNNVQGNANNWQSIFNNLFGNNGGLSFNNANQGGNNCSAANGQCGLANGQCGLAANPPAQSGTCVGDGCNTVCDDGDCGECSSYAEAVLELVNAERVKAGLKALVLDDKLCAASDVRAAEIMRKFSHTRPDGNAWNTAVTAAGYTNYRTLGENIAAGYMSPQEVVKGWMNSAGHRANILNPNFTKMGLGYAESNGGAICCYWTQIFAG